MNKPNEGSMEWEITDFQYYNQYSDGNDTYIQLTESEFDELKSQVEQESYERGRRERAV